jgi:hypothetical protein
MVASFLIITGVPVLPMMLRHHLLSLLDNLQESNVLLDGFLNHLQVQEPLRNWIWKSAFHIGNLTILKNLRP